MTGKRLLITGTVLLLLLLGVFLGGRSLRKPLPARVDVGSELAMGEDSRPRKGSGPWWRYVLIAGLGRMADDPRYRPDARQARLLLEPLERVAYNTRAADYLWPLAFQELTPAQRDYVLNGVRLPPGICTCPCASWNPLVQRVAALLKSRAGPGEVPPLVLPEEFPEEEPPADEIPPGLQFLQGLVEIEGIPELRLTPAQARRLLPGLTAALAALDEIEKDMDTMRRRLTPDQRSWMRSRGEEWLGGRTGAELEERWEAWEEQALQVLRSLASPQ